MRPVTLQISLAPSDYGHAIHLLPHQIKAFGNQVDEILLTYDVHRSKGHFATNWVENNEKMWSFLGAFAAQNPKIRLIKIDYAQHVNQAIAKTYFGRTSIPAKDWRGGPFYTYFFGIHSAKNDLVFHIDSDLFFGGLSQQWIGEAVDWYEKDEQILFINPIGGPPRSDGTLVHQVYQNYKEQPFHFLFQTMSTRLFLVDRTRLAKYKFFKIRTFKFGELLRAVYRKNPAYILPEEFISKMMAKHKLIRLDFKGSEPGLWSLHPPYRTADFYQNIPETIRKIEQNEVPESQKGFYDIVDELVNWSEAKAKFS